MMIVMGFSLFSLLMDPCSYPKLFIYKSRFMTSIVDFESRSPVGSSSSIIEGEFARDRAIALNYEIFTLVAVHLLRVRLANDQLFLIAPPSLTTFLFSTSFIFISFDL